MWVEIKPFGESWQIPEKIWGDNKKFPRKNKRDKLPRTMGFKQEEGMRMK